MIVGNSTAQDFWLTQFNEAQAYNAWVMDQVAPSLGGRVLEIGCGVGSFTVKMAARGHAVTAVDIDANVSRITRTSPFCRATPRQWTGARNSTPC